MADQLSGQPLGSHLATLARLSCRWRELCPSTSRGVEGGGGTQPASGVYTELGFGVMPGIGREVLSGDELKGVVPFVRNEEITCAIEAPLGDFMSDVSAVLHAVLPSSAMESQGQVYGSCPRSVREVYQYPSLRPGVHPLHSHQVVLRKPYKCGAEVRGKKGQNDLLARQSVSDLHVDTWDGGGELGTCTVHTCKTTSGSAEVTERESHLLLHRGVVVFPRSEGGRGVHIRSVVPGWHCALLLRTSDCLHGSVVLDESDVAGFALPRHEVSRIVTYPLRRIERMLERVGEVPGSWRTIRSKSKHLIQRRAEEKEQQFVS